MSRLTLPRLLLVVILFVVLTGIACSALASPPAEPGAGRDLSRDDWVAHLPLACVMALFVIGVDGAVVLKIILDRRKSRRAASSAAPAKQ